MARITQHTIRQQVYDIRNILPLFKEKRLLAYPVKEGYRVKVDGWLHTDGLTAREAHHLLRGLELGAQLVDDTIS